VTLVTGGKTFWACPFNSSVIAGVRAPAQQEFGYDALAALGIAVAPAAATKVDAGRPHRDRSRPATRWPTTGW
jgi:hypothetical protein